MLSNFQFSEINLKEVKFFTNDEFEKETNRELEETISFETRVCHADNKERNALVELVIAIGGGKSPYNIEMIMRGIFEWNNKMSDELAEQLLKTNAPALLLSYARPIMTNLTMNGRFNTVNIPYIDFTQNLRDE